MQPQPQPKTSDNRPVLAPGEHNKHDPADGVPPQSRSELLDVKEPSHALAEASKTISNVDDTVSDMRREIRDVFADFRRDIQKMNNTLDNIARQKEECHQKCPGATRAPEHQPKEENRPKQELQGKENVPTKEKRVRFEDDTPEAAPEGALNPLAEFFTLLAGLTDDINEYRVATRYRIHVAIKGTGAPAAEAGGNKYLPGGIPSYIFDPEVAQKIIDHYESRVYNKVIALPESINRFLPSVLENCTKH
ncbi:mRNA capping enzyme subunit alpha [Apiospora arundinis]